MSSSGNAKSNAPQIAALILAIIFVAAVLAGARVLVDRHVYKPVGMSPVNAPKANSQQCHDVVNALPNSSGKFRRVDLLEPAPEGAAAYRNSEGKQLTVRCGVDAPDQYTKLTTLEDHGGGKWMHVKDATPGSNLNSWYQVGGGPVLAVSGEAGSTELLDDLGASVKDKPGDAPTPRPFPLSDLKEAKANKCEPFLGTLPPRFEGGYHREQVADAPRGTAVYLNDDGLEPIVIRCGVAMPKDYQPGATINQVNEVPWFEDASLAQGSTAGLWYAVGHEDVVALRMPGDSGNSVITQVSDAIAKTMDKRGS